MVKHTQTIRRQNADEFLWYWRFMGSYLKNAIITRKQLRPTAFRDWSTRVECVPLKIINCSSEYQVVICICIFDLKSFVRRSTHCRCSVKEVFLKISQNSYENTCVGVFLSYKNLSKLVLFHIHLIYEKTKSLTSLNSWW